MAQNDTTQPDDGFDGLAALSSIPVIGPLVSGALCFAPLFVIFWIIQFGAGLFGYVVDFEADFMAISLIALLPTLAWTMALEEAAGVALGISVGQITIPYKWVLIGYGVLALVAGAGSLIDLIF